jgi:3-phenylpropionate/trans-cinnamate dioxygenase ferredoxin reductase component
VTRAGLVVVGGGPAAHAAAAAYREVGGAGAVVLLSAEGRRPYNRPPLSKELLRGELEPEGIALEEPSWYADRDVGVRAGRVTALDLAGDRVLLDDGEEHAYEACVLATGAEPVRLPVDGADLPNVHLLRTVEDALALRVAARPDARAVVVGSGFIGCEAAASLRMRGCDVALLSMEPAPQTARLGPEVGARLAGWLEAAGVAARYDASVERIEATGDHGLRVVATEGDPLDADLVLLAAGVRPRSALARDAGLELGEDGEVAADETMRTSAPRVLACGDCARARHALAGRPLHVEHWGDALAQGEIAGTTAAGGEAAWSTVPGFWSTIGERTLKYAAWGDGFDGVDVREHGNGAFTAWYEADGRCVGVLAHERDEDYEAGRDLIERGAPVP